VLALNLALNNNNPAIKRGGQMGRRNPFTFNPPLALYFFCFVCDPLFVPLCHFIASFSPCDLPLGTRVVCAIRNSAHVRADRRQENKGKHTTLRMRRVGRESAKKKEERKVSGTESICLMYLTLSEHFL